MNREELYNKWSRFNYSGQVVTTHAYQMFQEFKKDLDSVIKEEKLYTAQEAYKISYDTLFDLLPEYIETVSGERLRKAFLGEGK